MAKHNIENRLLLTDFYILIVKTTLLYILCNKHLPSLFFGQQAYAARYSHGYYNNK